VGTVCEKSVFFGASLIDDAVTGCSVAVLEEQREYSSSLKTGGDLSLSALVSFCVARLLNMSSSDLLMFDDANFFDELCLFSFRFFFSGAGRVNLYPESSVDKGWMTSPPETEADHVLSLDFTLKPPLDQPRPVTATGSFSILDKMGAASFSAACGFDLVSLFPLLPNIFKNEEEFQKDCTDEPTVSLSLGRIF